MVAKVMIVAMAVQSPATEGADTSPMIPSLSDICTNCTRNRDMRRSVGNDWMLDLRSKILLTNHFTLWGVVVGAFSPFFPLTSFLLRFGLRVLEV